jgi:monofunctional glycosyltransferase
MDIRDISPYLSLAVMASEDQRFPQHFGLDLTAIGKAVQDNRHRKYPRGASTITQQVAKNLFLWPGRSLVRKGLEAYLTLAIEILWPKKRILEMYLNVAELGEGVYGAGAAAKQFFGKKPSSLDMDEAALLAAVLPNPVVMKVNNPSAYMLERQAWIKEQMDMLGGISFAKKVLEEDSPQRTQRSQREERVER